MGFGPGLCVGAALKLKDTDRLVIGVIGDGDCMMGINAFWTAAHITSMLIIVANNRSYYNDELHQEGVARHRGEIRITVGLDKLSTILHLTCSNC